MKNFGFTFWSDDVNNALLYDSVLDDGYPQRPFLVVQ
jgi:hypothetical protein